MDDNVEEFENLKCMLKCSNAYEPGMSLGEMRQLIHTLIDSMTLAEEESWDPVPNGQGQLLSSTLIDAPMRRTNNFRRNKRTASPLSSPEVDHVYSLLVEAEVHHDQDWSPRKVATETYKISNYKRAAVDNQRDVGTFCDGTCRAGPSAPKRALLSNTFKHPNDSGCSCGRSESNSENDQSIMNCDT